MAEKSRVFEHPDMHLSEDVAHSMIPLTTGTNQVTWNGLIAERRRLAPCELVAPPFDEHLISLHVSPSLPARVTQEREGTQCEETFLQGDMTLMPAGRSSYWRHSDELNVFHLRIQPSYLAVVAEAIDLRSERVEIVNRFKFCDSHIESIGRLLLQELQSSGTGGKLYIESLTTALVIHLLRDYSAFKQQPQQVKGILSAPKLRLTIDYIHEHLGNDMTLSELAGNIELSPYHFARLFKQSTGITPHQYLLHCRLEEARHLLLLSNLSISQIALSVGFTDQSHLTRYFKRTFHVTPTEMRRETHQ